MSRKGKRAYVPKPFESIEGVPGARVYASIYVPMLQSKAYRNLTNGARTLYTFMKAQYRGAHLAEHLETEFVFNWAMANKTYGLYTNKRQFYTDIDRLVQNGFIEVVEHGKNTRTKNIYRYSDKWKSIS